MNPIINKCSLFNNIILLLLLFPSVSTVVHSHRSSDNITLKHVNSTFYNVVYDNVVAQEFLGVKRETTIKQ